MASKEPCPNCVNCTLEPVYRFSKWVGLPWAQLSCVHTSNILVPTFKFEISKLYLFTSLCVVSLISVSSLFCFARLKQAITDSTGDLFDVMILTLTFSNDVLFNIILVTIDIQVTQCLLKAGNQIEKILNTWQKYKCEILQPLEDLNFIRRRSYLYMLFAVTCSAVCAVIQFTYEIDPNLTFVERISTTLIFYIQMVIMSTLNVYCHWTERIFKRAHLCLKADLEYERNKHGFYSNKQRCGKLNLKDSLSMYCQFYTGYVDILKNVNTCINPGGLVLLLVATFIFISLIYIILMCMLHDTSKLLNPQLILLELELFITSILFVHIIHLCDSMHKGNDDSLILLNKYPINSLTVEEALMVEVLLKVLKKQKPLITLSNVLPLRSNVYAVVGGVVLTYVLNIIQFQEMWTKGSAELINTVLHERK